MLTTHAATRSVTVAGSAWGLARCSGLASGARRSLRKTPDLLRLRTRAVLHVSHSSVRQMDPRPSGSGASPFSHELVSERTTGQDADDPKNPICFPPKFAKFGNTVGSAAVRNPEPGASVAPY